MRSARSPRAASATPPSPDAFVYRLVERRRREGARAEGGDIPDVLLTATDLAGKPLGGRTIRDECMMALFGGHETTGSLTWTVAQLAANPEAQQPHLGEVDAVLGRTARTAETDAGSRVVTAADLAVSGSLTQGLDAKTPRRREIFRLVPKSAPKVSAR